MFPSPRHIALTILSFIAIASLRAQSADSTAIVTTDSAVVVTRADSVGTKLRVDTTIYQGILLKYDLGGTLLDLGLHKGRSQSFDVALSCRLKNRYYPTLELGAAHAALPTTQTIDSTAYSYMENSGGFFMRAGVDLNGLKKHTETLNAVLIGVRLGYSLQGWHPDAEPTRFRADCWGEILGGCQVDVYKGLLMGWNVRLRVLFTRKQEEGVLLPQYIPGYGNRGDTRWTLNYYIGYKF